MGEDGGATTLTVLISPFSTSGERNRKAGLLFESLSCNQVILSPWASMTAQAIDVCMFSIPLAYHLAMKCLLQWCSKIRCFERWFRVPVEFEHAADERLSNCVYW